MTHLGFHHRMHFHHCFQQCCQTRQYALQISNTSSRSTISSYLLSMAPFIFNQAVYSTGEGFSIPLSVSPFFLQFLFLSFSFFPFLVTQLAFSPSRFCFLVMQPFFHLFQKYWFSLFQDVIMPFLSRLFFFLKINNVHIFKRFMNYP